MQKKVLDKVTMGYFTDGVTNLLSDTILKTRQELFKIKEINPNINIYAYYGGIKVLKTHLLITLEGPLENLESILKQTFQMLGPADVVYRPNGFLERVILTGYSESTSKEGFKLTEKLLKIYDKKIGENYIGNCARIVPCTQ